MLLRFFTFFPLLLLLGISSPMSAEYHHVEDCTTCHWWDGDYNATVGNNLFAIRQLIKTPNSGYKKVVFTDKNGTNSYADGDMNYDGVCEVCHTVNNHHRNDGSDGTSHLDGERCTACHLHENEFAPPVQQAHRTHLDYRGKGPLIQDCTVCHTPPILSDPNYQYSNDTQFGVTFRDGQPLETTTACNNCHSPWGAYPGGDEATALMDPVLGAKANFRTGIYESDGYTLKPGKEKWCVTCHDDRPSTSLYDSDPNPAAVIAPQVFEYGNEAMTFSSDPDEYNNTSPYKWTSRTTFSVKHKRCEANNAFKLSWMTLDFNVSQSGSYMFLTKWSADTSTCNDTAAGKYVNISLTDSSGTTYKTFEQDGIITEYTEMATFDVVAGSAQLRVSTNNAQCQFNIGPITIEPQGGSGGGTVVLAPMIAGDNKSWGYYATGHGVSGVQCTECHDPRKKHIDYDRRSHDMGAGQYDVIKSWGDSYRLQTKDPIADASLCARCHDMELIWEDTGSDKFFQSNYRRSNRNQHSVHVSLTGSVRSDSDWDGVTDSDPRCTNCHNVHGSTKPHMFRDGSLVSTPYSTDMQPMFEQGYRVYAKATWKPVLLGGEYEVFARWPDVNGSATNAPFTIKNTEMFSTTVKVDQTANADTWVSLGTYSFSDDNMSYVILNDKEADGTVIADAVQFVSAGETVIIDNGDAGYTTLGVDANLSGATGYNGDYDAIAAGTTDSTTYFIDYEKPLVQEERNFYIEGTDVGGIVTNKICRTCHASDVSGDRVPFTGPKVLNRFEKQRWVLNNGNEDANVYITARDYDSNISSVTLDLTSLPGGSVVAMSPVGQQLYHYKIPAGMIAGLPDVSYRLPVTVTDTDGQVVTDETYLFPKEGADTIYLDTNNVELSKVHYARFAVNTGTSSFQNKIPDDSTYFGPGYRFTVNSGYDVYATWTPEIPVNGRYEVYGFWDDLTGSTIGILDGVYTLTSGDVNYTAYAADGTYSVTKSQAAGGGGWNYIGTYSFLDDESGYIRQAAEGNHTMVADAMKFVRVNAEPRVKLNVTQRIDGEWRPTRIFVGGDRVNIAATGSDYDSGDTRDTLTYNWSGTDAAILDIATINDVRDKDGLRVRQDLNFNPAGLAAGVYTVQVTVSDSSGATTTVEHTMLALETPPTLSASDDTDNDGMDDAAEGLWDTDEDGIPNYLDAVMKANEIPDGNMSLMKTEAGLFLRIGTTALQSGYSDGVVTVAELATQNGLGGLGGDVNNTGGLFDFEILNLKMVGMGAKVVLPLQGATVPAGAVYKKYIGGAWQDFQVDASNKIYSAMKVSGVCPDPGDSAYTEGLTAGHECIQLLIQDGGPNDADGFKNAQIRDPGGLVLGEISGDWSPQTQSGSGGSGAMEWWALLMLAMAGLYGCDRKRFLRSV